MSMLLSAQTGTAVTPAQLLGTEVEEKKTRMDEAQRSLKTLLRRMTKAGLSGENRKQIVETMQAAASPRLRQRALAHG